MLFKSLRVFEFNEGFTIDQASLSQQLNTLVFESVADSQVSKAKNIGWYAPAFHAFDTRLAYELGNFTLICLRVEERKIKPAMIGAKLRERIQAHKERLGELPKSKDIKQYQEEIEAVLLRRIPSQDTYIYAMIDHKKGRILVDAGASAVAEELLAFLRKSLGSLKIEPVYSLNAPGTLFTQWLLDESVSEPFYFGNEATLKAPGEKASRVSLADHDLICDEVACHLNADKLVQQIGLVYDNQLSFVIDCDLAIKKIKFVDFDVDLKDQSPLEAFDTTYSIVSMEYQMLIDSLLVLVNK